MTLAELGQLLDRAAARRAVFEGDGIELSRRPAPSGGAIAALELYPNVRLCTGLDAGLYHYEADTHRLRLIGPAPVRFPGDQAQVALAVSLRHARIAWKYQRIAYQLALMDLGVLYQTLWLTATAMGLGGFPLGSVDARSSRAPPGWTRSKRPASARSCSAGRKQPDQARARLVGTTHGVASRSVRLSSPDRVLFPDEGITKEDLFEYYRAIAPVLVPHLRNRPFTMKRRPYGLGGDAYFQKQAPKGMPSWIPTRTFRTYPRTGGSRLVDFPLVNSPEALLWMVQMNCIDMNAWYSRVDKPDRPDFVLFDLDPPDGGFALAIQVAHLIREELDRLDLESYAKTSGADGIHVLVPIARRATFEQTYTFSERVARGLEARHPGLVTTEWLKRKREGVLVDHRQNARGKTIASVYSVRPKPGAPVSTPLRWDELTEDVTPRRFGMREALERVEQHGDLFEPVLGGGQALGPALRKSR